MRDENKIFLEKVIDIEKHETPFGKRWGGQTIVLNEKDLERLKQGELLGLDVQNEYIVYLKFDTTKHD